MRRAPQEFARRCLGLSIALAVLVTADPSRAVPANDDCADATLVTGLPFIDVTDTAGATRESGERTVCAGDVYPTVWYRFTPPRDATLCVRTALSNRFVSYPLVGGCGGDPVNNYFHSCGPWSDYTFSVARNTALFVQVVSQGFSGDALMFTMADAASDSDGDGVGDCEDLCIHTPDAAQGDIDFDRIGDACDVCFGVGVDLDGDLLCGDRDNCPHVFNPGQENSDFDSAGDACDECSGYGGVDADGDGLCEDYEDNCPTVANPDQADADGDSLGDACDPCFGVGPDPDGDGLCGEYDNCATVANPDQADADEDGFGDACDGCPGPGSIDTDGDGVCDEVDRCPTVFEAAQSDRDGDGVGDACDPCPAMPLPNPVLDTDGDGRPDLCDACRDDPSDGCVSALACTQNGALLRVGRDGGSFVGWTDLPGCKGLAVQPGTGLLFTVVRDGAAGEDVLATIDPATGSSSLVAPIGDFLLHGLAFGPDGTLFAHDRGSGALLTIDPSTGSATVVGATGVTALTGYGLAYDTDGMLLLADQAQLFTVDPETAAAEPIAALEFGPFCSAQSIQGLVVDASQTLLGLLRCDVGTSRWSYLVTLDRGTGRIENASSNLPRSGGIAIPPGLAAAEHCDNCRDDDGDGFVDFEDPDCCERGVVALATSRLRLASRPAGSVLAMAGRLEPGSLAPSPFPLEDVHVQLHDEASGAAFCGIVPAASVDARRSRSVLTFADPAGVVSSARGIERLALRDRPSAVRFAIRGRGVPFATPAPGPLRVTLAFHSPATRLSVASCHRDTVTTHAGPAGALRFP